MITRTTTIGWSRAYSAVLALFGVFLLFCGWGTWSVNARKTESVGGWALLLLFEVFFVGTGLVAIGYRMAFTVVPGERRVRRALRFFGIPLRQNTWSYTDFDAVSIHVTTGGRGSRSAAVQLLLRSTGKPVIVTTFMMGGSIPRGALDLARELSQTLGIRFTPSS